MIKIKKQNTEWLETHKSNKWPDIARQQYVVWSVVIVKNLNL